MPGVVAEKVVAKFLASDKHFAKASGVFSVSLDSKVEKLEGAVDGFVGASLVPFRGPF